MNNSWRGALCSARFACALCFWLRASKDTVSVGGQVLSGLHHIHLRNIIHRDLHIDNVLVRWRRAS